VLDVDFITQHTRGFAGFAEEVRRTNWDDVLQTSGLTREQIERIATIYMRAKAVIIGYGRALRSIAQGRRTPSSSSICFFSAAISVNQAREYARCAVTPTSR
jgi:anaerobic selenocysteine-containing dehydrogenase